MAKLNLYDIQKGIDDIQNTIKIHELMKFRPIDYRDYIETDLDQFEVFWKHNNVHYRTPGELYDLAKSRGYDKTKQAWINMLKNPDRQPEMWFYEIQLIYASFRESINYYITCEGWLLTKSNLSWVRGNPYNSYFDMMLNGERTTFDRAYTVYKIFKNNNILCDFKPYHLDANYGNCGVDNLLEKKKKDEEVRW